MRIGFNSVLFGGHPLETAFRWARDCGYDGIELSAIDNMSEHLVLSRADECATQIEELAARYGVELLAIEQPSQDPERMRTCLAVAKRLGIPVINCGPGGKSGDEESLKAAIGSLRSLAAMAGEYGVTLCVKAHVGAAIHDTPTTLRVLEEIDHPAFGLDIDPSHIHRADEDAVEALRQVVGRVRHVHVRDCKGRQHGPGKPEDQANGRGDIDLLGFVKVLQDHGYQGGVNLEVIGAREYDEARCVAIAAETKGHLQASLRACGAR
ncbi:MAG TPA: sugar phosphate isomerase/epimerase [Candidatus Dormibacteraeota bacterium]|jgi:sugar phosphate isomerase/epimerase|nr:sugar phosphate isomerase/epimerase [Candidatus Dormibacteraeota bacterium]